MTTANARRLRNLRPNKSGDANRERGRLQRQVRRAFEAHGDTLSASTVYAWCVPWPTRRLMTRHRWSVIRVLKTLADPIDRLSHDRGRPWLWRLRERDMDAT
jgi:hypothetical protein